MTPPTQLRADVSLRPLGPEHAAAMLRWTQDPTVADNLGLRAAPSAERTAAWLARALGSVEVCPFAIYLGAATDAAHVGNVILDRIDAHLQTARLSIYIGEASARGAGVGRAALHLALQRAFDPQGLDLYKVWLTVHARNQAALQAYLAAGFTHEGTLRGEFLLRGERVDALYLGALRAEITPAR